MDRVRIRFQHGAARCMASQMENGDYRLDLITEEAIKTGRFTQGGGAPTIDEFWQEKTGRALG